MRVFVRLREHTTDRLRSWRRMRISLKLLLAILTAGATLTTLSYWSKCSEPNSSEGGALLTRLERWRRLRMIKEDQKQTRELDCLVNDEYVVSCRRDVASGEVYVPFSFLRKYFEVYGKVVQGQSGYDRFEWQHSYSKVYHPKGIYRPDGGFLWFENYNVEVRDRVKCISATEGVPVSTQWDSRGHYYPIQVAQFGLSHFSKNLTEGPPSLVVLEDGSSPMRGARWKGDRKDATTMVRQDGLLKFSAPRESTASGLILAIQQSYPETTLSVDISFMTNGSLTAVMVGPGKPGTYAVHYITSNMLVESRGTNVFYGIGSSSSSFKRLTRDLVVDLQKGLSLLQPKKVAAPKLRGFRLRSLVFRGSGSLDNLTLSSTAHEAHFFAAADWLVRHQDERGGWPIMVTRRLSSGMLELSPGWYSAMAQGQAMSLLVRTFKVTGDLRYLETAMAAVRLLKVRSENRGVMTTFLGKYVWFEEYPTVPSSFVLNGFIYSLIGLYDLKTICSRCRDASDLFAEGMVSLKKMLPLFDTGSGSIYDLRHFSLGVAPNLARWDYHTTHINQLLLLTTIDDDPILKTTADRWIGYMKGKRSPHN